MIGHFMAGLKDLGVSTSSKRRKNRWVGPVEVLENRMVLSPTINTINDDPGVSIGGSASGIEEGNIQVEFDWDQDGNTDSMTNTNSLGWFLHEYPAAVSPGDTLSVRAVESGEAGQWMSYTLSDQNSQSLRIGAMTIEDRLLEVEIEVAGNPQDVQVSFDVYHDGVVESVVTPHSIPSVVFELPEIDGSFTVFIEARYEGETASRTIEVTGISQPEDAGGLKGVGGLERAGGSEGPESPPPQGGIPGFGMYAYLLTDTGVEGDCVTDQAVFAVNFGEQLNSNSTLEIDLNGDGVADSTLDVSGADSVVFDATDSVSVGEVTVSFRLIVTDPSTGGTVMSEWISVTIQLAG